MAELSTTRKMSPKVDLTAMVDLLDITSEEIVFMTRNKLL